MRLMKFKERRENFFSCWMDDEEGGEKDCGKLGSDYILLFSTSEYRPVRFASCLYDRNIKLKDIKKMKWLIYIV